MRLLCFQARRFAWTPFEPTLADAPAEPAADEVHDAVVAFVHVEQADCTVEREATVFRQALKHLKWLAKKRALRTVVLHSFTHLGADGAEPADAQALLVGLAERLRATGYTAHVTAFGWRHEWELAVYGESLAKVWKQV